MEYRVLPHDKLQKKLSVLGLGMGGIHQTDPAEIEATIQKAIENGITFFDCCFGGKAAIEAFGKAIRGRRDELFLELHYGAVFNEKGEYGWSRDLNEIKKTMEMEYALLGTDYADCGFLHCVDTMEDYDDIIQNGILDYLKELKMQGKVHMIGFSSHTPAVADRLIDTGMIDLMLFSINPAYDFEKGDEYGIGTVSERYALFHRCQKEGIGISVMKPFHGGQLLEEKTSPFHIALTHAQCIQYAIDRPGVVAAVPGVRNTADLEVLLQFADASPQEKDYAMIAAFTPESVKGSCVYCNHCQPCPAGIDVGLINKYYDLSLAGDAMAANHYQKLSLNASDCLHCGHCNARCPFGVDQSARMEQIAAYFG